MQKILQECVDKFFKKEKKMTVRNVPFAEGPFADSIGEDLQEGVLMREMTVIKVRNGFLVREIHRRDYMDNGDYNDTSTITPITKVE